MLLSANARLQTYTQALQGYLKILLLADQTTTGGDALYGEFSVYAILRDV
ncbi:MAG TPA: hypothetical protein PKV55_13445 [Nitrospira sp.]|nr:hypothetical protein [Nitrospira sp.]HNK14612.1 hypothetical protein [Nitrospira sp.]